MESQSTFPDSPDRNAESELSKFARQLAGSHSLDLSRSAKSDLLERLESWELGLGAAHSVFRTLPAKDAPISRAGEWMLDNFYVVKQTFVQIQEDLPASFLAQLPKLGGTVGQGTPRIFGLAWEWIGYSQSQIDLTGLATFVQHYQEVTPLTIGELWALPIMLRIGFLERLVYAATELTGVKTPKSLNELPRQFASQALPNESIVANCFLSLRLLSATDWNDFFEQVSRVEQILRRDPTSVYAGMDFETRNSYRSVIEDLARHSDFSEEEVAHAAIGLAEDEFPTSGGRKAHVGFYLRDAGRRMLEDEIRYQRGLSIRVRRALLAAPTLTYLGSIAIISGLFVLGLLSYARLAGGSLAELILLGALGLGLALESAVTIVHWNITHRIGPQSLPRMDFSDGIPPGIRTMVVFPTLLESTGELNHLLQGLELAYLANPDPLLTFALLTDFGDAPAQDMPEDQELLELARAGVDGLNRKYEETAPFYLFHRQREWNQSEGVWMGWERKRGKLAEFNHLLLGKGETSYTSQVGNLGILPGIKYVITLDADTSLPQGSANRLIATLAHPLNHAEFAEDGRSVVAGYTVLQPRVTVKPTSANRSLFAQVFAGNPGFDLYSFAVSDVYQDLFGEGSYVGKGIYDVTAFERSLAGQVRDNTLLSHDLFEGIYGRAALVTDVILYEDYPAIYMAYARRLRRWVRGDWQLLPWLFPIVHTETGRARNRLSVINLWKVFDNLRRSLLPPSLLALLAAGWLFLPGSPLVWTGLALLPSALPIVAQAVRRSLHKRGRLTLRQVVMPIRLPLMRWALSVLFLPHEALLTLGAIGTTLVRLFIAHKKLLQWTTAANVTRAMKVNARYANWSVMAPSLVLTILLGAAVAVLNPAAFWVAIPVLIGWLLAPQLAYSISKPVLHNPPPLSEPQRKQVLRLARRTWAFFERFVGPEDHWLPPDHFQESPLGSVAHYTTPTNIGLLLVSTLAAHDLGYIGLSELAVRLRSTLDTMDRLEHHRGHLLNWYDSQTLVALPPRYISTVDSGNLAASLITLKQGLLTMEQAPVLGEKPWQGLLTILDILSESLRALEKDYPGAADESFEDEFAHIHQRIRAAEKRPADWTGTLDWLAGESWEKISRRLLNLLESHPDLQLDSVTELKLFLDLMNHHLQTMQRSQDLFAPWLRLLNAPPQEFMHMPAWQEFEDSLPGEPFTLGEAAGVYYRIQVALSRFMVDVDGIADCTWCQELAANLTSARITVISLMAEFRGLIEQAEAAMTGMDFRFLFNSRRQVFHIGYNATTELLDPSFYDLLASEARVASLIAIAKGDVTQSHWQHLGRPVTEVNNKQLLLSWSGTMFEYLMPTLFVKNYPGTFLADSCYVALDAQANYRRERQAPWGISESGYYGFDVNQNYQYRAFGVPDLGYKRELHEGLVIAPYASLLGLSLQPQAVLENMAHLERLKMLGRFGFYEALDYSKTRIPAGGEYAIVQSYMAHHQGMILVAACNYLSGDVMVQRFHADERVKSVELLLQEKISLDAPLEFPHTGQPTEAPEPLRAVSSAPWRVPLDTPMPQVHVLTQGDASVMITNAGGGYSQWRKFALTRWQADSTLDAWGTWIYVQDCESGAFWSATCQPVGCRPEHQDVMFYPYKAEFRRWDNGISLRTEIAVGAGGVEIRHISILNDSDRPRRLKLTSYGEVALAAQAADRRHPAFNKLFIESDYLPRERAIVFERRPRTPDEKPVVLIHALVSDAGARGSIEYESDRAQFLGRGQTARAPLALVDAVHRPSGTTGGTLDPIFSLTQEITLKPHVRTRIAFLTLAAPSRAEALEKLTHYPSGTSTRRALGEARRASERVLIEQGLNASAVQDFQGLLSALLYPMGNLRAAPHILAQNDKGQAGLWAFGISGDFPILLVRVRDGESNLLAEALQAFAYWRSQYVTVNLVILNEQDTGYGLDLHNAIMRQVERLGATSWLNQREGIFILRDDQIQPADRLLFETVAGVILDEETGSLAEHARRLTALPTRLPAFTPSLSGVAAESGQAVSPPLQIPDGLTFENGLGGFSKDGSEYVIHLKPGEQTPHPWINVIANPEFGFLVSEAGSGCTWAENSGENRLTPWRNDPVTDMPGEVIYLRDEETGQVWSPTPMPAGAETGHMVRHGAGYSTFESQSHDLNQSLRLFVAPAAPVKIAQLRLQNLNQRPRRITVTYYAEWVLGTTRDLQQAHILPEFDPERHALLASNRFNTEFGERVAFLAANKRPHGVTADRSEFLGRLGDYRNPAALSRIGLASAVNAGLDPCAALQLHVDLAAGATEDVTFFLGQGANRAASLALIEQVQAKGAAEAIWEAVHQQWDDILSAVQVNTPDASMDLMLNRWMLTQTLACRLWGRTALYQSSGAFGFRDQLQDVLALLHTRPDLARAQILEAARHQFEAGDVLHWWNPPSGRGVRTRYSDDLLWLPFATAEYVMATGDESILTENLPFLKGEALKPAEVEHYTRFAVASESFTLYEHCRRALERGATTGIHGLPLMGGGDWNDGMNRVGVAGRGESVWLGWFLHATLKGFAGLAERMKDDPQPYLQQAKENAGALEAHAWDGEWYLRAFYDDGSRLGTRENNECQIDSVAQSWAVLSGGGDPARAAPAMESVNRLLVLPHEQMILLLTPPFDNTARDPGYIKGYLPGVRENGGQYTHAAIWVAWAFARLGQGDRAAELFRMLNPISHADTPEKVGRYRVEPYVIAADVYSATAHVGRGGWTWYTGSSAWMYRLGLEAILGISRLGPALKINPCIPKEWPGFKVDYRFGKAHYEISVENPDGVNQGIVRTLLDGKLQPRDTIPLLDDGQVHQVQVLMGGSK
ncbi:MAG: cellobiose phosphorylase [Anaerolineae bacterium]|nr:MAG: cellobiose phosphorylase [Anaerolineae bacterium]